jgi:hypothetical protein
MPPKTQQPKTKQPASSATVADENELGMESRLSSSSSSSSSPSLEVIESIEQALKHSSEMRQKRKAEAIENVGMSSRQKITPPSKKSG